MKSCPNCEITWESPNTIPENLLATGLYGDIDNCKKVADNYGWTEENDKRFWINVIYCKDYNKEYSQKIRYYLCTNCHHKVYLK